MNETKTKTKLELKYLTPYFNFGLKVLSNYRKLNEKVTLTQINYGIDEDLVLLQGSLASFVFFEDRMEDVKPILRPLSDLNKEIEINGIKLNPLKEFSKDFTHDIDFIEENKAFWQIHNGNHIIDYSLKFEVIEEENEEPIILFHLLVDGKGNGRIIDYVLYNKLIEWHFDVNGLINKNLAVDINTLNK